MPPTSALASLGSSLRQAAHECVPPLVSLHGKRERVNLPEQAVPGEFTQSGRWVIFTLAIAIWYAEERVVVGDAAAELVALAALGAKQAARIG